jgi:hypothetical protein
VPEPLARRGNRETSPISETIVRPGRAPIRWIARSSAIGHGERLQPALKRRRPSGEQVDHRERLRDGRPARLGARPWALKEVDVHSVGSDDRRDVPGRSWAASALPRDQPDSGVPVVMGLRVPRRTENALQTALVSTTTRSSRGRPGRGSFRADPRFAAKAGRVLDLYARVFEGRRLRPDEYVICADEKSQLQALGRRHATVRAAPGRPALVAAAAARWPTSPPGTSTTPTFSTASRPRPASSRSRAWCSRS